MPYLNNWKLILLTIGINVLCAMIFRRSSFSLNDLLADTIFCAAVTAFLDVFAVAHIIRKKRAEGSLPREVPASRLIHLLPRNRFGLSAVLALAFALFMLGVNGALFQVFSLRSLSLPQFLVWKAAYSLALSTWIVEFAIFRLVQPDCGECTTPYASSGETVKNPVPRFAWFPAFLKGMIFDFGFNVAAGLLLGGTVIRGTEVILMPTPCRGIGMLITTALTGVIVAFFVIPSVAAGVLETLRSNDVPPLDKPDRFFAWIPSNRWLLTLFMLPFFVLLTVPVCGGIFLLFDFKSLNFFQFYLIRALYIPLLCKAVLPFVIRRYRQPDVFINLNRKPS